MQITLKDKVIVITGASKGLGKELATRCAAEEAKVVINYHQSAEAAFDVYQTIIQTNSHCLMVQADVTSQDEVRALCQKTLKQFGRIDILINNAGICNDNLLPMLTEKQWKQVIDVNLHGVYNCSRVFVKEMIRQRQGKIINIASLKGQLGSEGQTNYSASKAAIIGFTKALAKEVGRFNISVNAVCPGFIVTDLNRHNQKKVEIAKEMSLLGIDYYLSDFLNFVVLLSSDQLMNVSGRVFNLDSRL